MSTSTDDTLLARWLEDQLSAEELEALTKRPDYPQLLQIKQMSEQLEVVSFDQQGMYERVKRQLDQTQSIPRNSRRIPAWTWGIAASLALLLAWYLWPTQTTPPLSPVLLASQAGESLQEALPDGTFLQLNADSRVEYLIGTAAGERQLSLQGEAYLRVAKGGAFTVNSPLGRVEVLGTEFSVYARDSVFRVHTYEGRVAVRIGEIQDTLLKGEGLEVRWQAGWEPTSLEIPETAPGWTTGTSTFWEVPLWEVMQALERQYAIELVPMGIDTQQIITTSFRHDDLMFNLGFVFDPLPILWDQRSDTEIILRPE